MTVNANKPFSLPSAGGVVSLLNDGGSAPARDAQSKRADHDASHGKRPQMKSESSKAGDRLSVRLEEARYLAPRRSSSTATLSTEVSKSPSPYFDARGQHEQGSASSHLSAPQSTESSTDGSLDSQKRAPTKQTQADGSWRSARLASHSSDSSLQSDDEANAHSPKRHRGEDGGHDGHVLNHTRYARSPVPYEGSRATSNPGANVPTSMRQATDTHQSPSVPSGQNRTDGERQEGDGASSSTSGSTRRSSAASRVIGGKKRYPCTHPGCGKTFSTSGHAARHNRIHTGSKPYRCTFPGCSASFSRQDNSLQHYRTHVLHPKGRNGTSVDGSFSESTPFDGDLQSLDPETVASVRLGRKALEEGTAIAVVQEYVDGNGRRGEAIQRMVGQPRSGRRGSTTSNSGDWGNERRLSMDAHTSPYHAPTAMPSMPYHAAPQHLPPPPPPAPYMEYSRARAHAGLVPYTIEYRQREAYEPMPPRGDAYGSPPTYAAPHPAAYPTRRVHPYEEPDHPRYGTPAAAPPPAHYADRYAHEGPLRGNPPPETMQRHSGHARRSSLMSAQAVSSHQGPPEAYPRADLEPPHMRTGVGHRRIVSGSTMQQPSPTGLVSPIQRSSSQQGWAGPSRRREMQPAQSKEGLSLLLTAATTSSPEIAAQAGRERTVSEHGKRQVAGLPGSNSLASMTIQSPPMPPIATSPSTLSRKMVDGDTVMRQRRPSTDLRLPLPAASKMPYSSDRSTTAGSATTPLQDDPASLAKSPRLSFHEASERWGAPRTTTKVGAVQLPPLRRAVAGDEH